MENEVVMMARFWYGSIFDEDILNYQGSEEDFLSKIRGSFATSVKELIYENNAGTGYGLYKSWRRCHVCDTDLMDKVDWHTIKDVCNHLNEICVLAGPFYDENGEHHINVCEKCLKTYFRDYITERN